MRVSPSKRCSLRRPPITKRSQAELERIDADKAYWKLLSDLVGWTLAAWTYRSHALYITSDAPRGNTIQLDASQRDQLVAAILS